MKMNSDAFGFLLVDKKEDVTSTYVDIQAKKAFNTRRVGHLGTLDPFASGLLLLAIGEATKLLSLVPDSPKTYEATIQLGQERDTLDRCGNVLLDQPVPPLDKTEIKAVLNSFLGQSKQMPPRYSAKWIDGKRAYDLAREGIEFTQKPISITISHMELVSYDKEAKQITFRTTVSKGTYIRSLGQDIARKLNTVGYLLSLRRTRIPSLSVEDAISMEDIPSASLLSPTFCIPGLKTLELNPEQARKARNGLSLRLNESAPYLLLSEGNTRIALYKKEQDTYRCYRGFAHD